MKRVGKKIFWPKISPPGIINKTLEKYFLKKNLIFFFLIYLSRKRFDPTNLSDGLTIGM